MRRVCVAALLAGVAFGAASAAEPKSAPPAHGKVKPVDAELLEFLGSLDTEDEQWRDYLESRPIQSKLGKPVEQKTPPEKPEPKQEEQVKKP